MKSIDWSYEGQEVAKRRREGGVRPTGPERKKIFFTYLQKQPTNGSEPAVTSCEDFEATPGARKQIKDILNQLVKEGKVANHRGNRYEAPARNLIEGTIIVHRDGYGFVIPKERDSKASIATFIIPRRLTGSAMNGDKVKVEITLRKPGGRAEGRVVAVEKRARDTMVGQLRWDGQVFFVAPSDEKLPGRF